MKTYWPNQSYFFLFPLFLLVSIKLTVINPFSALFIDLNVGRINPETFRAALRTQCSGLSESWMQLCGSISDSSSVLQSSSLLCGLAKSPFQFSEILRSKMLWGALSSSVLMRWQSILYIQRTLNTWVRPPGRSFADTAGGKGDLSDNFNAAAPSCWKFDQNALMICSVSWMYPKADSCWVWSPDSFCLAHRV